MQDIDWDTLEAQVKSLVVAEDSEDREVKDALVAMFSKSDDPVLEKSLTDLVELDLKLDRITDYVESEAFDEKRLTKTPGGRLGDAGPVGTPGGRQNWVDKAGGLPKYIRMVAHALIRQGKKKAHAIAIAVNTIKRWARGGGNVSAKVQAAAAKALAEWEAKKGRKSDTAYIMAVAYLPQESKDAQADGSYPIENRADLKRAIQAYGRSKDKAKTKRHIIRMARKLGCTADLPDGWHVGSKSLIDRLNDIAEG